MRWWNYRVVHRVVDVLGVGPWDTWFVVEAYYDEAGKEEEVRSWAENVAAVGDSLDELRDDLACMVRALELPVIEYEDLPQPKTEETDADTP